MEIQSGKDSHIDGDVVGGNAQTVNVAAPDLAALIVHLTEVAKQQAAIAVTQAAITAELTRVNKQIVSHDHRLEQFAAIALGLFEQVFAAVDDVSAQLAIAQKMAELQVLVSSKSGPQKRTPRGNRGE